VKSLHVVTQFDAAGKKQRRTKDQRRTQEGQKPLALRGKNKREGEEKGRGEKRKKKEGEERGEREKRRRGRAWTLGNARFTAFVF